MTSETKMVRVRFSQLSSGDVFMFDGSYYVKLFSTDDEGNKITHNAVDLIGELCTFDDEIEMFWCPKAVLKV